jgi:hypothetical protein
LRLLWAKSEAATLLTVLLGLCISFAALLASFLEVVISSPVHRKQGIVKMKRQKKVKRKYAEKLSLKPLKFDEAVSTLLTVKPMPKAERKAK